MSSKKSKNTKVASFFIKNKKILLTSITLIILATIIGVGIFSKIKSDKIDAQRAAQNLELKTSHSDSALNNQIEKDIVFGNPNAPLTIIEYASLSCPHCANFYNKIFDKIEENYIKTGKVKFIYRDFPLNQSAMMATLVSLCTARNNANNPDKYYKFIKVLFKTQESWAFEGNFFEKLRSLAKLDGMSSQEFDDCANNTKLVNEILADRLRASKELNINSTPSFIINGELIGGYREFEEFKTIIDQKLSQQ